MPDDIWRAFNASRVRIEAFALRYGNYYKDWVAAKGLDAGELHPHALINAVWVRILNGEVTWDPTSKPIEKFFAGEIHNRVRSFTQRLPRPDRDSSDDELPAEDENALRNLLSGIERTFLLRFVARQSEPLSKLAELILAGLSKGEIEERLGISDDTRRRWEKKLAKILEPRSEPQNAPPRTIKGKAS